MEEPTMTRVSKRIALAAGAGLIATAIVLFIAFMVFFVQDAPNQIRIRDERIAQLGGAPDAPIAVPHLSRSERAR